MEIKYGGSEALTRFLLKCRETFASITHTHTKSEIIDFPTTDSMEFITVDDIDIICGTTIEDASVSEVTF